MFTLCKNCRRASYVEDEDKIYCQWYKDLVDPEKVDDCPYFRQCKTLSGIHFDDDTSDY